MTHQIVIVPPGWIHRSCSRGGRCWYSCSRRSGGWILQTVQSIQYRINPSILRLSIVFLILYPFYGKLISFLKQKKSSLEIDPTQKRREMRWYRRMQWDQRAKNLLGGNKTKQIVLFGSSHLGKHCYFWLYLIRERETFPLFIWLISSFRFTWSWTTEDGAETDGWLTSNSRVEAAEARE